MDDAVTGKVISVNGPIVKAAGLPGIRMYDIAEVGPDRLIGEVIRLVDDVTLIQVYEDNTGLEPGDEVTSSRRPLSVLLGPGLIANIYDGIQRPLVGISEACGSYIEKGIKLTPLDTSKRWEFTPLLKAGDLVSPGDCLAEIRESPLVMHRVLIPVAGRRSM
jgi:V/A-type H+-transporting ATPase subunit A